MRPAENDVERFADAVCYVLATFLISLLMGAFLFGGALLAWAIGL